MRGPSCFSGMASAAVSVAKWSWLSLMWKICVDDCRYMANRVITNVCAYLLL